MELEEKIAKIDQHQSVNTRDRSTPKIDQHQNVFGFEWWKQFQI